MTDPEDRAEVERQSGVFDRRGFMRRAVGAELALMGRVAGLARL